MIRRFRLWRNAVRYRRLMRTLIKDIPCMACGLEAPPIAIWIHQISDPTCRNKIGTTEDALRRMFVLYNMGIPLESGLVETVMKDVDWSSLDRQEQSMILFMLMTGGDAFDDFTLARDSTIMTTMESSIRNSSNGDIPDMNLSSNPLWESWDDDGNADGL